MSIPCIGIDLGTTFSVVAYVDDRNDLQVIPNASRNDVKVTPSVVLFEDEEEKVVVGSSALDRAIAEADRVVQFVKREMGVSRDMVRQDGDGIPHPYRYWGRVLSPEEISAYILKRLKADAEAHLGMPVTKAVITVPAYFHEPARVATETAGKLAGFEVLTTLPEPMAAAVAYGLERATENQNVLVFDLGGGTFDVTFMRVEPRAITMLHTDGDHRLGGKDWDDVLMEYVKQKFTEAYPSIDPSDDVDALQELRDRVVRAKHHLSDSERTSIVFSCLGKRHSVEVTRRLFEELTEHLVSRCRTCCERAMRDLGEMEKAVRSWSDLDEVLLVGGSTRMPMIRHLAAELTKRKIMNLVNVDECVAIGAALRARQIVREPGPTTKELEELRAVRVTNVVSHSWGVKVITGSGAGRRSVVSQIIPRGMALPCSVTRTYPLEATGRAAVAPVMQGEYEDPELCTQVGEVTLESSNEMSAGTEIAVTYSLTEGEKLIVHLKDTVGGAEVEAKVDRVGILTPGEVDEASERLARAQVEG